jgi:uncharacterized membrane protein
MQNAHPLFVHFPIALLLAALVLEVLAVISRRESLRNGATSCLVLGALAGLVAMITGLQAGESVPHLDAAHEIMETHETLGIAVFILAAALSIVRLLKLDRAAAARAVFVVALAVSVALVLYGAFLGGKMVFDYGVGTALVTGQPEHHEHMEGAPAGSAGEMEREEEEPGEEAEHEEEAAPKEPPEKEPSAHDHGSLPHEH